MIYFEYQKYRLIAFIKEKIDLSWISISTSRDIHAPLKYYEIFVELFLQPI